MTARMGPREAVSRMTISDDHISDGHMRSRGRDEDGSAGSVLEDGMLRQGLAGGAVCVGLGELMTISVMTISVMTRSVISMCRAR